MNADELKAIQTHLKARYRDQPSATPITLRAAGRIGASVSRCVDAGRALVQDTDAGEEQIAGLLRLTERYCVVYPTLRHAPDISVAHARVASSAG